MKNLNLRKSMQVLIAASLSLAAATPAQARDLDYHPNAAIELGKPFDPTDPFDDRSHAGCFKWKDAEPGDYSMPAGDIGEVKFDVLEVRSREELYEKLNVSASLTARYGFAKMSASFAMESKLTFDDRSLTYVFTGSRIFSKEEQKGELKFNLRGRMLLWKAKRKKNPRIFFDACGSEIATSRVRGTTLAVVYHFQASTAEKAQQLRATLDAKFKSGSASFSLAQEVRRVDQRARIQTHAFQTGTDRVRPAILDLIELEPGNVQRLRQIMTAAMEEITRESSPILRVGTLSVGNLPRVRSALDRIEFQDFGLIDQELVTLQDRYYLAMQRIEVLRDLIDRFNVHEFTQDAYARMQEDMRRIESVREEIVEHAGRCLRARRYENCKAQIPVLPVFAPSRYLNGYVDLQGWNYTVTGVAQLWNRYHWDADSEYFPLARFRNVAVIDYVVLQRNGNTVATLGYDDLLKVNESGGSLRPYHLRKASVRTYWCWEGNPPAVCDAETRRVLLATARGQESGAGYRFVIKTVDGNTSVVDAGAPRI